MPIHLLIFYKLISVSYINSGGKSSGNASNLTVETVNIRGETTPTSTVFHSFIPIGRDKNPPWPPFPKGGTYRGLMTLPETETSNAGVSTFPPLKKRGQGGFSTGAHSFQSEHVYT